jgi:protein-S-isoprenylcysteine O-methyltransferase Ste14
MASSEKKKPMDLIDRGVKGRSWPGTATFVGLRAAEPFLQYQILRHDLGASLLQKLGATTLPRGPPLVTNTPLDVVGLSPYRSILLGMSVVAMLKQNFHHVFISQEYMGPAPAASVGAFNAVFNSINSLLFVCSQTSASVNGEHFPQTPLIVGASLFVIGITTELGSEMQRAAFKRDPANKGKIYDGGLFGLSRHINYFGYTLWRSGYALAAGGWVWGATVAAWFTFDFTQRAIPVLQDYLEERVSSTNSHECWNFQANGFCSTEHNTSNTKRTCRRSSCRSCTDRQRCGNA